MMAVPVTAVENLGSSLPVPSVRELTAAKPLDAVPPRYIRDGGEIDQYPTAALSDPCFRVPFIDLAKLNDPQHQVTELQLLHAACKDRGIFQLINHGVSGESLKSMSKNTVCTKARKSGRETLHNYSDDIKKTAVSTLGFIAMALGLDAYKFSAGFEDGKYDVRMNCYPSCPEPERVIGITSHADNSGITLLTDCGDTPGLQVLKGGHWVFIEPIADAIVVNVSNVIEIMSNGIYKAPYHRSSVNRWKERFSVVTFCYPNTNFVIGPASELTKAGEAALYKTLTCEEYLQSFYSRKDFGGSPFIDTLKI